MSTVCTTADVSTTLRGLKVRDEPIMASGDLGAVTADATFTTCLLAPSPAAAQPLVTPQLARRGGDVAREGGGGVARQRR